jgi:hypothetical protein
MEFEFTTLVVIGTDCTSRCKSNYHDHDNIIKTLCFKFQDNLLRRLKDEFCQGSGKSSALLEELKVMESYIDKEDYHNSSLVCRIGNNFFERF